MYPTFRGPGAPAARELWPPTKRLAVISDQERAGIVFPDGSVVALGLPTFDSPPVLNRLYGRDGSWIGVQPVNVLEPVKASYVTNTGIVELEWLTREGGFITAEIYLEMGPWRAVEMPSQSFGSRPRSHRARHRLVIRVTCEDATSEVEFHADASWEYGERRVEWTEIDAMRARDGAVSDADVRAGRLRLEVSATAPIAVVPVRGAVEGRCTMDPGDTTYYALTWADPAPGHDFVSFDLGYEETVRFWRTQLTQATFPRSSRKGALAGLLVALLEAVDYAAGGGVIASPTTSLLAIAHDQAATGGDLGKRLVDHRASWARDGAGLADLLSRVGLIWEFRQWVDWIAAAIRRGDLRAQSRTNGDPVPEAEVKSRLSGYMDRGAIVVGAPPEQALSPETRGSVLYGVWLGYERDRRPLDADTWAAVRALADDTAREWREPDHGVWDRRDAAPARYTASAVMSWVGLMSAAQLALLHRDGPQGESWTCVAADIKEEVLRLAISGTGGLFGIIETAQPRSGQLDAAVLLAGTTGMLDDRPDVLRATADAIVDGLSEDGLIRRYQRPDTSGAEDPSVVATALLVRCWARLGEVERAVALLDRLLLLRSEFGLYAEFVNGSGGQTGNCAYTPAMTAVAMAILDVEEAVVRQAATGPAGPGTPASTSATRTPAS
jgi:GH15 family glucan-1,4-alpha-glucosidase